MTLPDIILSKLWREHVGMRHAIKRRELLRYLHGNADSELTDREMRRVVEFMPKVCTCERGYFIARNRVESDYSILYLKKKAYPIFKRVERIREAYPEFYRGEQMELFRG